jgi:hypothetical protein
VAAEAGEEIRQITKIIIDSPRVKEIFFLFIEERG